MRAFSKKVVAVVSSKWFFIWTLIALAAQSLWVVITARYPLPFDESFHFGIIQVYAKQWLPGVLTSQPDNPGAYGELIHDPSYLYHYLMSFPYRVIDFLFHNIVIDIGSLRIFSIVLFIGGLIGFRKLLFRFGASRTLTHAILFVIMLTPVSSYLAAQVNYDNFLFCLTPIFLWFTLNVVDDIKKRKLTYRNTILMLSLGMLTCLVKYAFLPIFVIAILYVIFIWLCDKKRLQTIRALKTSFVKVSRKTQVWLAILFVISTGLFLQRYGYNAVVYRAVQPDCAQVLTVKQCLQYGPWARNYKLEQTAKTTHNNLAAPARNPIVFARGWYHAMIYRLYFTIDQDFNEYAPLPLPFLAGFIFGTIGLVLTLIYIVRITKLYKYASFFVVIILAYGASLFLLNYQEYLRFGSVVAVNGRYLMPILPLLLALIGVAYREFLRDVVGKHALSVKVILLIVVSILSIDGGGILGYLIYSTPHWYLQGGPLTGVSLWIGNAFSQVVLGGINEPIDHLINDLIR